VKGAVLLTGGSGFVGSAIARALIAAGYGVRALVRPTSPRNNIADLGLETVDGDMCDPAAVTRAMRGVQYVVHAAADYRLWARDREALVRTNVEGTRTIMEAALALSVERVVEALATRGLPVVIVNPSTPVGPRDIKPTPTGRVIVEAARGRMPAFVDTGMNLAHVDDVAAGLVAARARARPGERYILGGDNVPLREMLREIARLTGRRAPTLELPRAPLYPLAAAAEAIASVTGREPLLTRDGLRMSRHRMYFTSEKAMRELGYRSRPCADALRDAVDWFRGAGYLH
jgi:dihydroflavonol-4-reductase